MITKEEALQLITNNINTINEQQNTIRELISELESYSDKLTEIQLAVNHLRLQEILENEGEQ